MNPKDLFQKHKENSWEGEGLYKEYASLSKEDIEEMVDLICAESDLDEDSEEALTLIVLHLALYAYAYACGDKLPQRLYDYLLEKEIYYFGEMYLRADEQTALRLIQHLKKISPDGGKIHINHILCALGCIPCEAVKNFFTESSRPPLPAWAKDLYIPPMGYSTQGGWTAEGGKIMRLFSDEVQAFEACPKGEGSSLAPLSLLNEHCAFCGRRLTLMFDGPQKLACCTNCSCYQTVFTQIKGDAVLWHPKNKMDEFLTKNPGCLFKDESGDEHILELFDFSLRPSQEKRKAAYTAHQFAEITRTQRGGMPTAVNDVKYPYCPDCGKTMAFAAQMDMDDMQEIGEGLFYFFTCNSCGNAACNYDQS